MAKDILDLAIIGPGGIFMGAHAKNLAHLGGNRIVAVAEVDPARRDKAAKDLNCRAYADFAELIAKEQSIDALIVATPPTVRLGVFEAAAKRMIPVFCEKPPAFTADDARKITEIVQRTKLPTSVGFMYRYLPAADFIREQIKGQPIAIVNSAFMCPALTIWNLPGWFKIKEKSGGHIIDQAVHVMDLIRYLVGDITLVHTLGGNTVVPVSPTCDIEDSSATSLRFASGAQGTHVHSWGHSNFFGEVSVYGKEFRLNLHLDARVSGYIEKDKKIDQTFPVSPQGCSHHHEEMKVFLDAVRSKDFSKIRSPYPDAAKTLYTVVAMAESIKTAKPVAVK